VGITGNVAFKYLFNREEIILPFLNDIIKPSSPITKITYNDTEVHESGPYRRVLFDVKCTCSDNQVFLVECQKTKQAWFSNRAVYCMSRDISLQRSPGVRFFV
jgi:hypothetical protein